jgi:membrane protease subunit HflC
MQAYEAGLRSGDTRMVLSPNSDFFRFFNDPNGRNGGSAGQATTSQPSRP